MEVHLRQKMDSHTKSRWNLEKTVQTSKTVRFFVGLTGTISCVVTGLILHFIQGSEIALVTGFCVGFVYFIVIWIFSGRFWIKKMKPVEEENSSRNLLLPVKVIEKKTRIQEKK